MSRSTKTKHRSAPARKHPAAAARHRPVASGKRSRVRRKRVHPMVFIGAGIAVLAVLAVMISFAGGREDGSKLPVFASVEVSGTGLPAFVRGPQDRAVGMKAPEVRGTGFDGAPVVIAPTGRPQIVLVLAHWCPHCRDEVAGLSPWLDENGLPEGVDLFAISTWADPAKGNFPPGEWLRDEGWPVRTLVDDRNSSAGEGAFGLRATPFWIFLDGKGTVVGRVEAVLGGAGLQRAIDALKAA